MLAATAAQEVRSATTSHQLKSITVSNHHKEHNQGQSPVEVDTKKNEGEANVDKRRDHIKQNEL